MLRRILIFLWAVLLGALAACGSQPMAAVPAATAAPPRAPTAAPAVAPSRAAQTPAAAPPATAARPAGPGAAAIPDGLTPEGYHMLGRPDAPVTLVMYSDFL